jgi:hypothetical protein
MFDVALCRLGVAGSRGNNDREFQCIHRFRDVLVVTGRERLTPVGRLPVRRKGNGRHQAALLGR